MNKVSAKPDTINVVQPDGYVLRIFLRGDENHKFSFTVDSIPVAQNETGFWVYCYYDVHGNKQLTRRAARNIGDRSEEEQKFIEEIQQPTKVIKNP